mmetsp:Transcript_35386/g.81634  ORF Transcript_35386/g.81634 Transcript_35386/m.81634 type:complete len:229 (-) Transcript_35386:13-699(-)
MRRTATSSSPALHTKTSDQIHIPSVHFSIPGLQMKPSRSLSSASPSRPSSRLPPQFTAQSGTPFSRTHGGISHSLESSGAILAPAGGCFSFKYRNIKSSRNDFPVRKAPITPTTAILLTPDFWREDSNLCRFSSLSTTWFFSRSIWTICSGAGFSPISGAICFPSVATSPTTLPGELLRPRRSLLTARRARHLMPATAAEVAARVPACDEALLTGGVTLMLEVGLLVY